MESRLTLTIVFAIRYFLKVDHSSSLLSDFATFNKKGVNDGPS